MPSKQVEDVYNAQRAAGKIDSRGRPIGKGDCRMYAKPGADEPFLVRIMAVDGKWAMVRRPGMTPFVVSTAKLSEITPTPMEPRP